MKKLIGIFSLFFVFSFCPVNNKLFAQDNFVAIVVRDSVRDVYLDGATVKFIFNKDTSKAAVNSYGYVFFQTYPGRKYKIIVSYVGYKTKTMSLVARMGSNNVVFNLEPDAINLNQIIVKGQEVMMLIKGDTIKYNITALKTMEGDDLIEAIKMIPGITMDEHGISHLGKPINRVYVNNTLLFGKNKSEQALTTLKADEVKNVEIYEESTDRAKFIGLENGEKQKVINIVTKKKLETIIKTNITSVAGSESDNDNKKYNLQGSYSIYNKNTNFYSNIILGNTPLGFTAEKERGTSKSINVNFSKNSSKKFTFFSTINYSNSSNSNKNSIERNYLPSDQYNSRNYNEYSNSKNVTSSIGTSLVGQYVDSLNLIQIYLSMNNGLSNADNQRNGILNEDGIILNQLNSLSLNSNENFSFSQNSTWTRRLKKPGRSASLSLSFSNKSNWGNGSQIDTNIFTTNKLYDLKKSNGITNSATGVISYGEPIVGGEMNLRYEFSITKGYGRRDSKDMLLGIIDTTNTYNNETSSTRNKLSLVYTLNKKKINIFSNFGVTTGHNYRDEQFPLVYKFSRQYTGADLNFNLKKDLSTKSFIEFSYNGLSDIPSLESLRGVVNNSNPLFLRAGNPDLKSSFRQNINFKYTYYSVKGSVIALNISGSNNFRGVTVKKVYFNEDEYFAKYNYTFHKGNTLNTSVNVSGIMSGGANLSYSKNFSKIKGIFNLSMGYTFSQNPFFNEERLVYQVNNSYNLTSSIQTNFSKKFIFNLSSDSRKGFTSNGTGSLTSYFSQRLTNDIRSLLFGRLILRNSLSYNYYNKPELIGSKVSYLNWNFSAGYKFKKDLGEIVFIGKDLLNNTSTVSTSVREDYLQKSYNNDKVKRVFLISLNINLIKRK